MTEVIASSIVNTVSVKGVTKSLSELDRFSKKLTSLKRQLGTIQRSLTINANVVQGYNKTASGIEKANKRVVNSQIKDDKRLAAQKERIRVAVRGRYMEMKRALGNTDPESGQWKLAHDSFERYRKSLERGQTTISDFNQDMRQTTHEIRKQNNAQISGFQNLKRMRSLAVMATATMTPYAGVTNVLDVYKQFQTIKASMLSFSIDVGSEFQYLTDMSMRLGVDLGMAAEGFTKLSVSTAHFMSSAQTKELFTGFSELARARGIDPQRYMLAAQGLQQMAA